MNHALGPFGIEISPNSPRVIKYKPLIVILIALTSLSISAVSNENNIVIRDRFPRENRNDRFLSMLISNQWVS